MNAAPFDGGRVLLARSAAVATVALTLTAVGGALDPRRALFAYLVAFTDWVGIAVGALILLMVFHASNARWMVVVRRVLESIPLSTALFLVLFLPIALGMRWLFPWADASGITGTLREVWGHRRPWLNVPFFLVRAAVYFAVWIAVSHLLHRWSVRQDTSGTSANTTSKRASSPRGGLRRKRRLRTNGLPSKAAAPGTSSWG